MADNIGRSSRAGSGRGSPGRGRGRKASPARGRGRKASPGRGRGRKASPSKAGSRKASPSKAGSSKASSSKASSSKASSSVASSSVASSSVASSSVASSSVASSSVASSSVASSSMAFSSFTGCRASSIRALSNIQSLSRSSSSRASSSKAKSSSKASSSMASSSMAGSSKASSSRASSSTAGTSMAGSSMAGSSMEENFLLTEADIANLSEMDLSKENIPFEFFKQFGVGLHGVRDEQTVGQKLVMDVIDSIITRPNCVSFIYETVTYHSANQEFCRFIEYVQNSPEPAKSELSHLFYPLYVYLYLELLRNMGYLEAEEFLKEYKDLLYDGDGYKEYIDVLQSLSSVSDVEECEYFNKFWSCKYVVAIPPDIMKELAQFLAKEECTSLLQILHLYILNESKVLQNFSLAHGRDRRFMSQMRPYITKTPAKLYEGVSRYDSRLNTQICMTTFDLQHKREVVCLDINKEESEIAFACSDSYILIKDLGNTFVEFHDYQAIKYKDGDFKVKGFPEEKEIHYLKYLPSESHQLLVAIGCKVLWLDTEALYIFKTFDDGHKADIWGLDINFKSSLFATASEDCTSCIYSLNMNEEGVIRRLSGHNLPINVVKFHPNGMYVATGSSDKTAKLHSAEGEALAVRSFTCDNCEVYCLCFTRDGRHLVVGGKDGYVRIFEINSATVRHKITTNWIPDLPVGRLTNICFNDEGSELVTVVERGGGQGMARIWKMRDFNRPALKLLHEKFFMSKCMVLYYVKQPKTFRFLNMVEKKQ